jgi:hypothetical protein
MYTPSIRRVCHQTPNPGKINSPIKRKQRMTRPDGTREFSLRLCRHGRVAQDRAVSVTRPTVKIGTQNDSVLREVKDLTSVNGHAYPHRTTDGGVGMLCGEDARAGLIPDYYARHTVLLEKHSFYPLRTRAVWA